MKQITLNIADSKFAAFVEFIKTLDYVKVQEDDNDLNALQESLHQVKLIKEGKLPKTSIKEFLDEL